MTGICRLLALVLLIAPSVAVAQAKDPVADPIEQDIRERLTEREDENRVEDPFTLDLFGNPLSLAGAYQISVDRIDQLARGDDPPDDDDRWLLEQELEGIAFYSIRPGLFFFAQARFVWERDLDGSTRDRASDAFVERGEMWIYAEDPFGLDIDIDIGRIEFEDDRLWWWDEERDAIRVIVERDAFDLEIAVAYELAPTRSDDWHIDPEEDERLRIFAELSHELSDGHSLEMYAIYADDLSEEHPLGDSVDSDREDDSDARLTWLGPRAIGGFDFGGAGIIGYWLDAAVVFGNERLIDFGDPVSGRSAVEGVQHRDVFGWGFDVGATWFLPWTPEPRVTLSYAQGSGDGKPDEGKDRAFRQSGLQSNETSFGGVQRFGQYGRLLEPELSNLSVASAGIGVSFLRQSSLDLVYHYYRLREPAESLRDARLVTELDRRNRDLGHALDLVLAIEEDDRFQIELSGSLFRSGKAFGRKSGKWTYGAFAALSIAF